MWRNIVLCFFSIVIGLGIIEAALRAFVPLRNVGAALTVYDGTFGKKLKASFKTTRITPEFRMRLTTNSLGFRGAEPKYFPYQPIMFAGDSFTLGYGVSDGREFPALVEKALRRKYPDFDVPVVNAGLGNIGNGYWLKFLRREGRKYNPRLIVLQLMANDFRDNVRERLFELSSNNELRELAIPHKSAARTFQDLLDSVPKLSSLYLVGFARQIHRYFLGSPVDSVAQIGHSDASELGPEDQLTFRLMEEILRLSKDEDWPVVAVTVGIKGKRLDRLGRLFAETYTPWISMPQKEDRPGLYYAVDGHWNAAGHAHAADVITDWLSKNEQIWKPGY
jgi:hypothetical protein